MRGPPRWCARPTNHLDVAAALVAAGADVNHKDRTTQSAYLISTAEVGDDPRLLELTLAHGADVDAKDRFDGTALIRGPGLPRHRRPGHPGGRRPRPRQHLGWTALLEAVILGGDDAHQRVVARLVEAGVDRSVRDRTGLTALQHARQRGYAEMVRLLSA